MVGARWALSTVVQAKNWYEDIQDKRQTYGNRPYARS